MVTCLCEVGLGCGAFPWIGGAQQCGITKDGMSKGKIDLCGVCHLRVKLTQFCVCSVVSDLKVEVPE